MQTELLASGLGFPEGPAVLGDGRVVLCDGNTGELLAYAGAGGGRRFRASSENSQGFFASR